MIFSTVDERLVSGSNGDSQLLEDWLKFHADGIPISSNQASLDLPFQRWFKIKEAFSPRFIIDCIQNAGRDVKHCLDPFGGSGTSALTCQFLGIKPTTIEVNPFLADLIEAKLAMYDLRLLRRDFEDVLSIAKPLGITPQSILPEAPPTMFQPGKNGRWVFATAVAQQILALSAAIDCVRSRKNRRLLRVVLGSVLIGCSNVIINGKGRRYRGRWEDRSCRAETVVKRFREQFATTVSDVERFGRRLCCDYTLIRADSRDELSKVDAVDLAIFSPPYPNSFDYTDIYNLELWMLGYLRSRKDNEQLRKQTLRSHVQITRSFDTVRGDSPELARVYRELVAVRSTLWNRHIPEMVTSYFCDLLLVLLEVHSKLLPNGRMFIAVGSSKYAGIRIDVPKILAELGTAAGLVLVENASIRSMRSSAQQGGKKELRESVLVFC